jgi:ATP-dependent DNA ligase
MMLHPPIEPMLASPVGTSVPDDPTGVCFEPKWDGFRCLVFRDGHSVVLQGRGRSRGSSEDIVDLAYAFPELAAQCLTQLPAGTVIDGEIVAVHEGRLDFGILSTRLRPRSEAGGPSIDKLAREHPASLLAFDALWIDGDLRDHPFAERRAALQELSRGWTAPLLLTPSTTDPVVARMWFDGFEAAGVDGLMVKGLSDPYAAGKRVQGKVKHQRTADVVVAGWRPHSKPAPDGSEVVGSLLLGLHDDAGDLQYIGVSSAFPAKTRAELVTLLSPHALADGQPHPWRGDVRGRIPGEANRWKKEHAWRALDPELVAEVTYDQMEADRFRHVAQFVRWRPDRSAASCTYDQVDRPAPASISELLSP